MSFRNIFRAFVVMFTALPAHADFSGVALDYKDVSIQFAIPNSVEADGAGTDAIRALLFADGNVVGRLAAAMGTQREELAAKKTSITFEISKVANGFEALVLSDDPSVVSNLSDAGSISFKSGSELVERVCAILSLQGCTEASAGSLTALTPKEGVTPPAPINPDSNVVVTIGQLPAGSSEQQVWMPENQDASPGPDVDPGALDTRLNTLYGQSLGKSPEMEKGDATPVPLPTKPKYFTVHCTAFAANDELIKRWVKNRKAEGRRNLSHGVLTPEGEWLPLWPFDDRRVWATKTETCAQTRAALGRAINIEVHYFCGDRRDDKPTTAQYQKLAALYKEVSDQYGPLVIVSHREFDRGLHDGHGDPYKFEFATFYSELGKLGLDVASISKISDDRHRLPTNRTISHHWEPKITGGVVPESSRPDDCKQYP